MKKIVGLVFFFIGILSANAQQPLTLSEAINLALQKSFDIQLAQNSLDISKINNHIGVAGGLPVVTATANDNETFTSINQKFSDPSRDTKRGGVGSNNLTMGVTGNFLLFNGARVVTTKKRLEELRNLNQENFNSQVQNTIASVMVKYYDVVRQQSYYKTLDQSIEVFQKRLDILKVRKEVGLSNNADLFQVELDLNALLQSKQNQELIVQQAKTDLLNLIFLPATTVIQIKDTILVDNKIQLDSIRAKLSKNPTVNAATSQILVNELLEKETAALRYPSLRANAGYNLSSSKSAAGFSLLNQSYGPFLGLNLSIPIYNGTISKRQQQVAAINTKSAKIVRDNIVLDIESSMVRSYQAYTNAISQIALSEKSLSLSLKLLDLVMQKFELSQATIIEVKQAQQSFENEGYRLVNLRYAAKLAEIELKRLANQLSF